VLLFDSASYDMHAPGGVGVVVAVGLAVVVGVALGVPAGVDVGVGLGHPGVGTGVPVGVPVGVGPTPFTDTQFENSDVLPFGSVAVAVIT
jgi:hypothetical protein